MVSFIRDVASESFVRLSRPRHEIIKCLEWGLASWARVKKWI